MTLRAIALAVGTVLALAGCQRSAGPGGPRGGMVVHVVGVEVSRQPIEDTIALVGTMAANESVDIKSELDGTVEEIVFHEGDMVAQGQVLGRIDRRKLEASLAEAEAKLTLAEINRQRYETLVASRAVSQQEYDQAASTYEATHAMVELMREQLKDATVTAPFDGVVGQRLISVGQFVSKGTSLTSLIDWNPMKVAFEVPERYLSSLRKEQPMTVSVAAYPQERFTGTVYFIDPQVDPDTRTALVKAYVPNPDARLRPGMFANLTLILNTRQDALVVPETALLFQGQTTSVFIVDAQQTAQSRPVKTGIRLAGLVEITEGLSIGDVVVTEGTQKLHPGAAVKVRLDGVPASASMMPTQTQIP